MKQDIWTNLPQGFTILAPMEGVTDMIFRQVIAKAGRPDLFFTEFTNVSSYASEKGRENALERLTIVPTDTPIIAQIWGKNPAHFAELASALEGLGFSGLDINMGCPDRHVNAAGGGAAMIRNRELAHDCIEKARAATSLPLSVKTRLGYTYTQEYRDWLSFLLQHHLSALTVHLRTKKEMSKVPAHFELIPNILQLRNKISPNTKLIINGDIKNLAHIQELQQTYPGIDGFMIGRGVFENPYCFTTHQPSQAELLELFNYHLDLFDQYNAKIRQKRAEKPDFSWRDLDNNGEVRGLPFDPLKHYFKIYIHTFPGASELRAKLMDAKNTNDVRNLLERYC